ncbi:MAG: cell division protein FtsZ [Candidatus Aenigmarchaeota archaeon ex4484_52]|nr:MAG: cell division protein FtsZ [Candidatus Aenigmarchaeota archaeon ex4484_52]
MDSFIENVLNKNSDDKNETKKITGFEETPQEIIDSSVKKKQQAINDDLKNILKKRKAKVKVVGCGGAGKNTLNRLADVGIIDADTIAINTDAQDLLYTEANEKILIGVELTNGLGSGSNPSVGESAAKESRESIKSTISKADMTFITCGLGGGTGTGSSPIVAEISKKNKALTVAIVTVPFSMEGNHRINNAKMGLEKLEPNVDTLIVIPNDKLLEIAPNISIDTAFRIADEILVNAVKGITELVTKPGLINLDFADISAVMSEGGVAMIGMGESDTEKRAQEAVRKALSNPLLDVDIEGATGALINVVGGNTLTLKEAKEVVDAVTSKLSSDAKIIWGASVEKELGDLLRVMVIVTGVKSSQIYGAQKQEIKQKRRAEMEHKLGIDFI